MVLTDKVILPQFRIKSTFSTLKKFNPILMSLEDKILRNWERRASVKFYGNVDSAHTTISLTIRTWDLPKTKPESSKGKNVIIHLIQQSKKKTRSSSLCLTFQAQWRNSLKIPQAKTATGSTSIKSRKPRFIKKSWQKNKKNSNKLSSNNFPMPKFQRILNLSMLITWKKINCSWDWQSTWWQKLTRARKEAPARAQQKKLTIFAKAITSRAKQSKSKTKPLGLCFLIQALCSIAMNKNLRKYSLWIHLKNLNKKFKALRGTL